MTENVAISVPELLELIANRSDAWNAIWGFLLTVATALIAFIGSRQAPLPRRVLVLIGASFSIFAFANLLALREHRTQREHLVNAAIPLLGANVDLTRAAEAMRPPSEAALIALHVTLDVAVVVVLFLTAPRSSEK